MSDNNPEAQEEVSKEEIVADKEKIEEHVRAREKVEIIENITLAASGVLLLEGVTAGMEAAIPVLGATGIGIPLAATLFIISKMTRLYASKVELEQVIENCCRQLNISIVGTVYNQSERLLSNLNEQDRKIVADQLDLNESTNTLS